MSTPVIPSMILKQLYTFGSLENVQDGGVRFAVKNRLADTHVKQIKSISIDGQQIDRSKLSVDLGDNVTYQLDQHAPEFDLPLGKVMIIHADIDHLEKGKHQIEIRFEAAAFGDLTVTVEDSITTDDAHLVRIPRMADDYGDEAIKARQKFVEEFTGKKLEHIIHYSFDPHITQGNIEHFTGVAQIPIGFAGPLHIRGEAAQGDFLIPLATTEGTLVASYNRGIKLLNMCGGVQTTVVGDAMQRAPVFVFDNARDGRDFVQWVNDHMDEIRDHAESTSSVAKLQYIDHYLTNKFVYLRFNYSTGDAAGQNMVGRATFAACSWILDNYDKIRHFYLESNFATDKKASQVNIMRTRGKRVTAEALIKKDILAQVMRVTTEDLYYQSKVGGMGAFFSGANNNGAHSPNAITAMFIATGQDVANVAESSAGLIYTELTPEKDLYISITIPSLIVATYGGGTGLATQRECLEVLGCWGRGKVNKLAEIVAGVALAGELSLGSAIASSDWVSSHERYGRNR
ncbi:MAG: hydroxymethylglutaryl-CoA reductase [Phototrophicales bacterium]|nr:MAG: hydroxymethylglutaryl-CoA reductase [Phototrophicales bacterium]RMG72786.1 MAG: hydroxymethylglutaryl-CoA reductase [Chloroflexota bacterium]